MSVIRLRYTEAIITWMVVYPLITLLLQLLNPFIGAWPLPAQTLLVTFLVVLIMSFWAMPIAFRVYDWIEERASHEGTEKRPVSVNDK